MTLPVRQVCEPVLEDHGLSAFHAEMDNYTKNLILVTPCGDNQITIPGVKFSRAAPTKAELEYAAKLLDQHIRKHKRKLVKLVDLMDVVNSLPSWENRSMGGSMKANQRYSDKLTVTYKGWTVSFTSSLVITHIGIETTHLPSLEQEPGTKPWAIRLSVKDQRTMLEAAKVWAEDLKIRKAMDQAHKDLNVCHRTRY